MNAETVVLNFCAMPWSSVVARRSPQSWQNLTFEGIEGSCVLDHTDFDALTNATVVKQVCPLSKDRKGRSYKFPSRGTKNAKNE